MVWTPPVFFTNYRARTHTHSSSVRYRSLSFARTQTRARFRFTVPQSRCLSCCFLLIHDTRFACACIALIRLPLYTHCCNRMETVHITQTHAEKPTGTHRAIESERESLDVCGVYLMRVFVQTTIVTFVLQVGIYSWARFHTAHAIFWRFKFESRRFAYVNFKS